jgi:hypothetical protein
METVIEDPTTLGCGQLLVGLYSTIKPSKQRTIHNIGLGWYRLRLRLERSLAPEPAAGQLFMVCATKPSGCWMAQIASTSGLQLLKVSALTVIGCRVFPQRG